MLFFVEEDALRWKDCVQRDERPTGVGVGRIVERDKACNQQSQQDQIKSDPGGKIQEGNQRDLGRCCTYSNFCASRLKGQAHRALP